MDSTFPSPAQFLKEFTGDISKFQTELTYAQAAEPICASAPENGEWNEDQIEAIFGKPASFAERVSIFWHQRSRALQLLEKNQNAFEAKIEAYQQQIQEGHPANKSREPIMLLFDALRAENKSAKTYVNALRLCHWSSIAFVGGTLVGFPFVVKGLYMHRWRRVCCLVMPIAAAGALSYTSFNKMESAKGKCAIARMTQRLRQSEVINNVREKKPKIEVAHAQRRVAAELLGNLPPKSKSPEAAALYKLGAAYQICVAALESGNVDSEFSESINAVMSDLDRFIENYKKIVSLRKPLGECESALKTDFPDSDKPLKVNAILIIIAKCQNVLDVEEAGLYDYFKEIPNWVFLDEKQVPSSKIGELRKCFKESNSLTKFSIGEIPKTITTIRQDCDILKKYPQYKILANWKIQFATVLSSLKDMKIQNQTDYQKCLDRISKLFDTGLNEVVDYLENGRPLVLSTFMSGMILTQSRIDNDLVWCLQLKNFYGQLEQMKARFSQLDFKIDKNQFPWAEDLQKALAKQQKTCQKMFTNVNTAHWCYLLPQLEALDRYLNTYDPSSSDVLIYDKGAIDQLTLLQAQLDQFIPDTTGFINKSELLLQECVYLQGLQNQLKTLPQDDCFIKWSSWFQGKIETRMKSLGEWRKGQEFTAETIGITIQSERQEEKLHLQACEWVMQQFAAIDKSESMTATEEKNQLKADLGTWLLELTTTTIPFPKGCFEWPEERFGKRKM